MTTNELVTTTSALTLLANEVTKGFASEVGKSVWLKVKALFGWTEEPKVAEVPVLAASALEARPELLSEIAALLKQSGDPTVGQMVGTIHAKNVVVIQENHGPMTFN